MNITFNAFNKRRAMRGGDAAEFLIKDESGEYYLWMTKTDIKRNLKLFPECAEELNKGLAAYGNN
ncbi:hypothetical protein [Pseudoalteromonas rhizosphaerae]|uniref:hypothetical protein n=1 Tax=Pseudoalteromonas rhizosphaerae TaxID=2518973 RepID=UPI001230EDED|nr:hypothetical protein [Pseudoalteromonas rhizosphaerae]